MVLFRATCIFILLSFTQICDGQEYWCGTEAHLRDANSYSAYQDALEVINDHLDHSMIRTRSEKWFQVVVHVVTREGFQPVTRAQVLHQLDVLNMDFAGENENVKRLPEEFENLVTDTGLRFCLASRDPDDNPTSGITYTTTTIQNIGIEKGPMGRGSLYYDQLGGKTRWDPARYINIWVCEFGAGFLGFASMPGMAMFPEETGIVIDIGYFGALGNASQTKFFGRGHTLTHEMGHYLGLLHIWGQDENSCSDSDEVDDTPNAAGPYYGCPSGEQTSCGNSNMYQNFMDLTDDRCLAAFTLGQSMRMDAAIAGFYPALAIDHPCNMQTLPFDQWLDDLIWTYDGFSKQYFFYSPGAFMQPITVEVFSVDGKRVYTQDLSSLNGHLIDLGNTAAGIYIVRITDGEQKHVRKIPVY